MDKTPRDHAAAREMIRRLTAEANTNAQTHVYLDPLTLRRLFALDDHVHGLQPPTHDLVQWRHSNVSQRLVPVVYGVNGQCFDVWPGRPSDGRFTSLAMAAKCLGDGTLPPNTRLWARGIDPATLRTSAPPLRSN